MKLKKRRVKKHKPKKKNKPLIKRHQFTDMDDEKYLLAFMLMDHNVIESAHRYYQDGQLRLANISQMYKAQYKSVFEYYEAYRRAPKRTMKYIHEGRKIQLTTDEIEIDEHVLSLVANEYAAKKEGYEVNVDYIIDVLLPRLIRTRKMQAINLKLNEAISQGQFEKAEGLLERYEVVTSEPPDYTYGYGDTLTTANYEEFTTKQENQSEIVFRFDNKLGDISKIIPPLRKQWLVSLTGTTKSGKSHLMLRMAMDAVLNQKRKVIYLNPEMSEYDTLESRIVPHLTGKPSLKQHGKKPLSYWYPVIDCLHNQQGTCKVRPRLPNKRNLLTQDHIKNLERNNEEQLIANYHNNSYIKWITCKESPRCIKCIQLKQSKLGTYFVPTIYFKYKKRQRPARKRTILRAFQNTQYSNASNLKMKYFPKYSATIDEQLDSIRRFMDRNKWQPDIVFWDYLDISKLDLRGDRSRWEAIDNIWKQASGFLQEIDALGITADQTTQAGRRKRQLDETMTSEASMKDHHIDLKMGLVKSGEESANNICRLNVIYDRHNPFNRYHEVLITQNLTIGNAITDSVFWPHYNMPPYPICLPTDD